MISAVLPTAYASEISEITDGVGEMSQAISEYGPLIVLLSIFFIIFILLAVVIIVTNTKMMKNFMRSKDSMEDLESDILNKFVDGALKTLTGNTNSANASGNALETALKNTLKPLQDSIDKMVSLQQPPQDDAEDYHKDLVGAYIDVNMAFKDASRKALESLKCNRVAIYVFHNGNVSHMGLPFFKMSCIHDWTNRGSITLRGKSHTDIPLHLFNDFIEDLWKNGYYKSENTVETAKNDPSILDFVAFSDTKSLYIYAIKNADNAIAGFVVAEFNEVDTFEHDTNRDNAVKAVLSEMSSKVSPIVGCKYVYPKRGEK